MKIIKYVFITLVMLLLVSSAFLFFYTRHLTPKYSGEADLPGLTQTAEVLFDSYGTPHIFAESDEDAFRALGYVHAQDRLWQMELMRRIAPGRLSELFGSDLVETDVFFRTLGIHEYSKSSVEALKKRGGKMLVLAEAYLQGVNQFQKDGPTPIECTMLGVEDEPFTLEDIYNITGYMSFSFANAFKTEPAVSAFAAMGYDYLKVFDLDTTRSERIKSYTTDSNHVAIANQVNEVFNKLPLAPFIGSNSWVIAPQKSSTGRVILCNDPHIGYSQPAVWYEAHLSSPGLNYVGYHVAGVPFAFLVHSEYVANGLTMFENDDVDFYREQVNEQNPDQYWAVDHWEAFDKRREVIKVKDSADVEIEVRLTRHGPVINEAIKGLAETEAPISVWWVYFKFPNYILDAAHEMAVAKNMEDMRKAAEKIHAPGLNLMYGDNDGNVAWWAVGKLVKRPSHVNSKLILDGASGADDPQGYYEFNENPQAVNPPWGYVYSANNQPVMNIEDSTVLYPGYYLPGNRAERIVKVLEAQEKFSKDDLKNLFLDSKSISAIEMQKSLMSLVEINALNEGERTALEQFNSWDGMHEEDTYGAAIYYTWVYFIYEIAMIDDLKERFGEKGSDIFKAFMSAHLMKRSIPTFISAADSPWWDDVATETTEGRPEMVTAAFKETVRYLSDRFGEDQENWKWTNVHTLEHPHPLGAVDMLKPLFNVGPFAITGSDMVVNNQGFPFSKDKLFNVSFGPSTRRIIDFSDINNSESILPTGQSGVPFSDHYDDQSEMYIKGGWRPVYLSRTKIEENATLLTLKPTN
ncbi:Penicillin amidase family protein [Fulvivirga imtechensis AK7]|uniref:Penicillin amidase family protein n=1 Tax=Fulvivirga imtechensis AK7 TaxID=1237149 RepID=L8JXL9_9BACT|nr:penicillin acylase family protein [Fulvivirga imtechensis]ELR73535.1 Penicillin amidase family protein [Fulvivirga imtechensis AK7]